MIKRILIGLLFASSLGLAADGDIVTINWKYLSQAVTLADNTTFTFSNLQRRDMLVYVTNPSNYNLRWPSTVKWSGGTAPRNSWNGATDAYMLFRLNDSTILGFQLANFSITPVINTTDTTAPARITDLSAASLGASSATLTWSSPSGGPAQYDVRYYVGKAIGDTAKSGSGSGPGTVTWIDSSSNGTASGTSIASAVSTAGSNLFDLVTVATTVYHSITLVEDNSSTTLTPLSSQDGTQYRLATYYIKAPPAGTRTYTATIDGGATYLAIGVARFSDVDQMTPFGTVVKSTATGTSPSDSVALESGGMAVDALVWDRNNGWSNATAGASQTHLNGWQSGTSDVAFSGSRKTANGKMAWTLDASLEYAHIAIPLNASAGSAIDTVVFASGFAVADEPFPSTIAGRRETMTITGLSAGGTYYFAVKSRDASNNWSLTSNTVGVSISGDTTSSADLRYVSTSATGGGAGTYADPWTWQEANDSCAAGMVIKYTGGTYLEAQINPKHSGTWARPITFQNYATDVCSLYNSTTNLMQVMFQNHIVVRGFRMKSAWGNDYQIVRVGGASDVALLYTRMHGGNYARAGRGPWFSVQFGTYERDWNNGGVVTASDSVLYCRIIGCYLDREDPDGTITSDAERGDGIGIVNDRSAYNILEEDTVTNASHFGIAVPYATEGAGSYWNIVRRCLTYYDHGGNGPANKVHRCLFEGNRSYSGGKLLDYRGGVSVEFSGINCIYRYNDAFEDDTSKGNYLQDTHGSQFLTQGPWALYIENWVYHNNFLGKFKNHQTRYAFFAQNYTPGSDFGRNRLKNNIFGPTNDGWGSVPFYWQHTGSFAAFNDTLAGNNFYTGHANDTIACINSETSFYTLAQLKAALPATWLASNKEHTPLWQDSTSEKAAHNFELAAGSPMIDSAVALTTVSLSTSGTNSIHVADAGYFHFAWGGNPYDRGDSIFVDIASPVRAEIDSVDYTNNVIFTKANVGVSAGAGVYVLATYSSVDGYIARLKGSLPDIGSHEK